MRKATDLEIKQFITYRSLHIALVERLGALVFGENYSDHDWDKCTCDEDDLNLYSLRNAKLNGDYNPTGEDLKAIEKLPAKHVKMNKHHPEYWDDDISVNNFSDDNPPQCHASKMPQRWLKEMCCDWAAVALKRNKPIFKWYNDTCTGDNPRFVFTDNQKSFIIDCLKKIQDTVEKEHITYPGIKYDAKQIEPIEELKEFMTNEDKDQILKFANEIANHGMEQHDLPEGEPKSHVSVLEQAIDRMDKHASEIKAFTSETHNQIEAFADTMADHGLEHHDLPGHDSYEGSKGVSMTSETHNQIGAFADAVANHGLETHDLPGHPSWKGQLGESMTKEDSDQILHFADEIKNHGLEYHDLPGHVSWDGVIEKQLDARDRVLSKRLESKNIKDVRLFNEMKHDVEEPLVKENKISECEMSGNFASQAPERVRKVVDPSGLLDNIEKEDKEKEVTTL